MLLHASCAALEGNAVLFLGAPGSGKSDIVIRLIQDHGWRLVADDQVRLTAEDGVLRAGAPPALRGLLEVRGLGVFAGLPLAEEPAPVLRLAVGLGDRVNVPRLPLPETRTFEGLTIPYVVLHAFDASAPAKIALALGAATGRLRQTAGAFYPEGPT